MTGEELQPEAPGRYRYALGADVGGTNLRAGLVRSDGQVLRLERRTGSHNLFALEQNLHVLAELFDELAGFAARQGFEIEGAGAAIGTLVSRDGVVSSAARPDLMPERRVDLKDFFPRLAHLPLWLENDAKAAAWGEYLYGAGRGCRDVICLTVGTGIGGGIIIDGKLYHGASGLAGHLGFLSVDMNEDTPPMPVKGPVEMKASGTAIRERALAELRAGRASAILDLAGGDLSRVDSLAVFQAARENDALAIEIIQDAGRALGVAIASYLHIFNSEKVIIGGGLAEQGELFLQPVRQALAEFGLYQFSRTPIVPAEFQNLAGVVGAAALAGFPSQQEESCPLC